MTITAIDPPVVTTPVLVCVLGCSLATLNKHITAGHIPQPDARAIGNAKLWKLSTLRAWRPDVADAAKDLINRKPITLRCSPNLPTAA